MKGYLGESLREWVQSIEDGLRERHDVCQKALIEATNAVQVTRKQNIKCDPNVREFCDRLVASWRAYCDYSEVSLAQFEHLFNQKAFFTNYKLASDLSALWKSQTQTFHSSLNSFTAQCPACSSINTLGHDLQATAPESSSIP